MYFGSFIIYGANASPPPIVNKLLGRTSMYNDSFRYLSIFSNDKKFGLLCLLLRSQQWSQCKLHQFVILKDKDKFVFMINIVVLKNNLSIVIVLFIFLSF